MTLNFHYLNCFIILSLFMSLSCDLCGLLPDRQASAGSCCPNTNISSSITVTQSQYSSYSSTQRVGSKFGCQVFPLVILQTVFLFTFSEPSDLSVLWNKASSHSLFNNFGNLEVCHLSPHLDVYTEKSNTYPPSLHFCTQKNPTDLEITEVAQHWSGSSWVINSKWMLSHA